MKGVFFVSFTAAFFNDRRRLMPVVVPPISSSGCRRARRRARHLEQHPCSGGPRPENFPPVTLTAATILAFVAKDAVALANSTETSRNTYGCESTLSIAALRYSQSPSLTAGNGGTTGVGRLRLLLPHPVLILLADIQLHHVLHGEVTAQAVAPELRPDQEGCLLWQRLLHALLLPLLLAVPGSPRD